VALKGKFESRIEVRRQVEELRDGVSARREEKVFETIGES
jgi:hypothetical protein